MLRPVALALSLLSSPALAECTPGQLDQFLTPELQARITAETSPNATRTGPFWLAERDGRRLILAPAPDAQGATTAAHFEVITAIARLSDQVLIGFIRPPEDEARNLIVTRRDRMFLTDTSLLDHLSDEEWATIQEALRNNRDFRPTIIDAVLQPSFIVSSVTGGTCLGPSRGEFNSEALQATLAAEGIPLGELYGLAQNLDDLNLLPIDDRIRAMWVEVKLLTQYSQASLDLGTLILNGLSPETWRDIYWTVTETMLSEFTPEDAAIWQRTTEAWSIHQNDVLFTALQARPDECVATTLIVLPWSDFHEPGALVDRLRADGWTLSAAPFDATPETLTTSGTRPCTG